MALKDIIGSMGIIPHLLVKEYDRKEDKINSLEDQNAALMKLQEQGSKPSGMKKGGKVSSASKRADGIAKRGKTRGKIV